MITQDKQCDRPGITVVTPSRIELDPQTYYYTYGGVFLMPAYGGADINVHFNNVCNTFVILGMFIDWAYADWPVARKYDLYINGEQIEHHLEWGSTNPYYGLDRAIFLDSPSIVRLVAYNLYDIPINLHFVMNLWRILI